MCLVVLGLEASEHYSLLFGANRDERHARPSAPAAWWPDRPHVLGGRDLVAGGSWLAVDRRGRLAAVTNFRDPSAVPAPRSRGELVADYLAGAASLDDFVAALQDRSADYGPFSLLLLEDADAALRQQSRADRSPRPRCARAEQRRLWRRMAEGPKRAGRRRSAAHLGCTRARPVRAARSARPAGARRRALPLRPLRRRRNLRYALLDRRTRRSARRRHVRGAVVRRRRAAHGRGPRDVPRSICAAEEFAAAAPTVRVAQDRASPASHCPIASISGRHTACAIG